jgi:hypothetical protein
MLDELGIDLEFFFYKILSGVDSLFPSHPFGFVFSFLCTSTRAKLEFR